MTFPDVSTKTMRAYRLETFGGPEVLRLGRVEVPAPAPGEVLLRVAASGVCGQDVMRRRGQVDRVLGTIIGHEMAGTVVAVGPGVVDFAVGDRLASLHRRSCHRCDACLRGRSVVCSSGVLYGESIDGSYADFCVVDELSLARIPDGVGFDQAAVAACAVGTGLHALRLAGVTAGQRVLVTGASGGVGLHALQLARAMGAEVIAVTSSATKSVQLEAYADRVVIMRDGRFEPEVRRRALQPDVVLDLTSAFSLADSLRAVRRGGTVVVVGNLENHPVEVLPAAFIIRELTLVGSKACTRLELVDCLDLIDRGLVDVKIHGAVPLEDAEAAHRQLATGHVMGRIVLHP
ncbi:alcohol dehydrogenase catalytic domain-containing protein [Nocardioides sp. AN3]